MAYAHQLVLLQVDIDGEEPQPADNTAVWYCCSPTEWAMWFGIWVTPKWLIPRGDDIRRPRNVLPRGFDKTNMRMQLALYGFNQRAAPPGTPGPRADSVVDLTNTASPAWNRYSPTQKRLRVRLPRQPAKPYCPMSYAMCLMYALSCHT